MSVTRLKRKHRKNIARANNETRKIKNLLRTPVLKNVDLDELKSRFPATSLVEKVGDAASAATDKVKEAATTVANASTDAVAKAKETVSDAAEAVTSTGTSLFERVKDAASHAVDAVAHNSLVEKATEVVQEAAHNLVESAKHALESQSPEENQATKANQTGSEGFDDAEAVTKPVNEDGQEGDKPKPEIAL
jgi:methyl-accepting chemotaxis protein